MIRAVERTADDLLTSTTIRTVGNVVARFSMLGGRTVIGVTPSHTQSLSCKYATLHPQCSSTFFLYVTLHCPIPSPSKKNNLPLHGGDPQPPLKSDPLAHPTPHPKRHNLHSYTELLLLLFTYDKLDKLAVSQRDCTKYRHRGSRRTQQSDRAREDTTARRGLPR